MVAAEMESLFVHDVWCSLPINTHTWIAQSMPFDSIINFIIPSIILFRFATFAILLTSKWQMVLMSAVALRIAFHFGALTNNA